MVRNSRKINVWELIFVYLAHLLKTIKEQAEKNEEERKEKEKQTAEDMVAKLHEDSSDPMEIENEVNAKSNEAITSSSVTKTSAATTKSSGASNPNQQIDDCNMEVDVDLENAKDIVTRSKTGALTPKTFNIDDLRRRTTAILNREDPDKKVIDERMTRLKSSQIANGTYLFKLGMENQFKSYINQFTTNVIALNKPQRNEERDKKRHLSHKFSLTPASEFKWVGGIGGNKTVMLNTIRQTILQLEQSIQTSFMHLNWHLIRKPWLNAVGACQQPKDFAKTLIVLQACIKPVVFANVWHEQLGHIKLSRITAAEREERKKLEKREKKEREEEEERNRMIITGYVKYTMGFKHQLWKQKGEEYRIHGRWGWLWLSSTRNHRIVNCFEMGLAAGPQKYMVQVRDEIGLKILSVDSNMYTFLNKNLKNDGALGVNDVKKEDGSGDYARPIDKSK